MKSCLQINLLFVVLLYTDRQFGARLPCLVANNNC